MRAATPRVTEGTAGEVASASTTRIVVVDDTDDSRDVTSTFLRLKGFDVQEASTGAQALELAAELPDLIVLDIRLPDIDGFEVCRRLKSDPVTRGIPVLHLSAHCRTTDDRIQGIEEGADAYLVQPVAPEELIATVKALLRRRQNPPMTELPEAGAHHRRRAEEAALALGHVGRQLTTSSDVMPAMRRAVETVYRLFRVQRSVFYELDPSSSHLFCVATAGDSTAGEWLARTMPLGEGMAGLAVAEGRPVTCADVLNDERIALPPSLCERLQNDSYRAIASVPLAAPGEILGAWSLVDVTGRVFTESELRLLSAFADQVALAMRNARLSQALEHRLRESHGLLKVSELVNSSLEPQEIARRAAREVTLLLGADTSIFFGADERTGEAMGVAGYRVPSVLWDPDFRVALTSLPAFFREAAAKGAVASDDVPNDPRLEHPAIRTMPLVPRSLLCVPVARDGRLRGALLTYWWTSPRRFSDDELRLATGVAQQLVMALDNAHMHAEQDRRRREAEAAAAQAEARLARMKSLAALSHLVNSSLDPQRVLDFVTDAALKFLSGDLAHLWLADDKAREVRLMAETSLHDPEPVLRDHIPFGSGVVGWVIEERRVCRYEDIRTEPRVVNKAWFAEHGYVSLIAVPLLVGDRALGSLVVLTKSPRQFSDEDAELLQLFAAGAATALENARLYQGAQTAYRELSQAQEQLLQAQKMEAVGQLAGGIAHDFNNLLTVIGGRSQLILKKLSPNATMRRYVEIIDETASRAAALTQQLLAFSRRENLQPRVVDVNRVVRRIARMLERLIGEHITLRLELADDLGAVRADAGRLEQALTNLCVNARDAQPSGGLVTIATRNVEIASSRTGRPGAVPAGRYIVLTVADRGCGMDAATQARIFEPFFTTKATGEGTGLGLSTVYAIVSRSGGHVTVSSQLGQGATFEIYLPRVNEPVEAEPECSTMVEPSGGSEVILLVEDDDGVRTLAQEILEQYGYRVLEAKNGEAALKILEDPASVDLIVTDVVMPEMGGRKLFEHIEQTNPTLKVLLMSGYPGEMTVPADVPDAGLFFLAKPFSPKGLADKVRSALDADPPRLRATRSRSIPEPGEPRP